MKQNKLIITILVLLLTLSVYAEYVPLKVKLNTLERFVVESLLPKETNFSNWKIINDLRGQLALSEEELVAINPQITEEGLIAQWDAVPEKEIIFGEITEKMIVDALKKLDNDGKLLLEHLSLYEKFIIRDNQ